ncbi:SDR family NAD(P)-dependent oxidoreductase [Vallitalea okinawensis]|uniref:SDR family NAD(P)-dependent oxidoreductase n=1 Tax=Vallitalea okinawensis TaxID=2078660 RepID=UPI000CFC81DB|nr:SDR family NAD(P)-dependent oxidoreductase [Vallitalea okinawensis]
MNIRNKVIIITGASSGIGRATALALSKYKNTIIIVARRKDKLEDVAEIIRDNGSICHYFTGDALDENFCNEVVDEVIKMYGVIDLAILNIGIGPPSNTLQASAIKIKHCMQINFDTFIHFYVPIMHQMKKQRTECMIAHMNSLASFFGIPMQGDYTAAKGAVRLFMQTARMELKHFGFKNIHIQTIHPGFVDTEAVRDDGMPAPYEISKEKAAGYIIEGIKKNKKENMFPFKTTLGIRLARRWLPEWLITCVVLSQTPSDY